MNRLAKLAAASMFCVACASAQAISVTMDFVAAGFGAGAPTDPVSGSFTYEADSLTAAINSMQAVSLSVGGHAYTLSEVAHASLGGDIEIIYGTFASITLVSGNDDFWLRFNRVTGTGVDFDYTTDGTNAIYESSSFRSFTQTETSGTLPEPATLALAAMGLSAAVMTRRRRRTA